MMADAERRVTRAGGAARRGALEWVGVVYRRPDPYIARPTWLALIADHRLRPIEAFTAVNPFVGGTVEFSRPVFELAAHPGRGKRAGVVLWHPEGKGLELYGDPAAMAELGEALAADIGGGYGPPGDA
jgi:hypothetical protein